MTLRTSLSGCLLLNLTFAIHIRPMLKSFFRKMLERNGQLLVPALGRHIEIRSDDIFLTSYPKSGNTWVRFLLANLTSHKPSSFPEANSVVPDVHNERSLEVLSNLKSPRILKSHYAFDPDYPKVIYLVRDPKSVCVSQFFFKKRRGEIAGDLSFEAYFPMFLNGFNDHYGSWGQHVGSWLGASQQNADFHLVRYEDLKAETLEELVKIVDFTNRSFSDEKIKKAIDDSSLESMQKIEKESKLGSHLKGKGDLSIPFVRKGSTTEWHDFLTQAMVDEMKDRFAFAMEKCDYLND